MEQSLLFSARRGWKVTADDGFARTDKGSCRDMDSALEEQNT